jgi:hypothetical protein
MSVLYVGRSLLRMKRVQHLEKNTHGSMYDTGSPQEREDARRLR